MGPVRLEVKAVTGKHVARPVSFSVHSGEVVGFFGLVGSGRSELMHLIFGAARQRSGSIESDRQRIRATCRSMAQRFWIQRAPYRIECSLEIERQLSGEQLVCENCQAHNLLSFLRSISLQQQLD